MTWASGLMSPSLPDHCEPSSQFLISLSSYFNTCIPTPLAFFSLLFGLLSVVTWLFSLIPQAYENYVNKSASGLSLVFLLDWGIGDAANVLGVILTNQASWQLCLAVYFLVVDIFLLWQYFWYRRPQFDGTRAEMKHAPCLGHSVETIDELSQVGGSDSDVSTELLVKDTLFEQGHRSPSSSRSSLVRKNRSPGPSPKTLLFLSTICAVLAQAAPAKLPESSLLPSRSLDSDDSQRLDNETIGQIFSWICVSCYLISRVPQLYMNWQRKSTGGLSLALFVSAILGNVLYAASLITNPNAYYDFLPYGGGGWAGPAGNDRIKWITLAFPFFMATAGNLLLDTGILYQFMIYRENAEGDQELAFEEAEMITKPTQCKNLGTIGNLDNPGIQPPGYGTLWFDLCYIYLAFIIFHRWYLFLFFVHECIAPPMYQWNSTGIYNKTASYITT